MPDLSIEHLVIGVAVAGGLLAVLSRVVGSDKSKWSKGLVVFASFFAGCFAYFTQFDDCTKYPSICQFGWAEQREPTVVIEAKAQASGSAKVASSGNTPQPSTDNRTGPVIHVPIVIEVRTETAKPPVEPAPVVAPSKPAKPSKPELVEKGDPICPEGFSCSPETGKRAAEREPQKMVAAWAAVPAIDPLAGLKASLKGELRRLNCLKGGDETSWGKDAVSAINRFNVYGYTKASAEPDEETLQMLRNVKEPVCP